MNRELKVVVARGFGAGAIAGMAMGVFEMIVGLFQGMSFFAPLDVIGHIVNQGVSLMHNSSTLIIEGLAIHMVMSMMIGAALALILGVLKSHESKSMTQLSLSVLIALAIGILNEFVIWASIDKAATSMLRPAAFLLGHVVFGVIVGTVIVRSSVKQQKLVSA
ncbi:MAG: hypothetical protein M0019_03810 [Actinomycetota bacterium]|nr:hypothetical protein [Actinomycetota bacterium]